MSNLLESVKLANPNNITYDAKFLAKRMLVDSIWKSANIEGLGTTFQATECILMNAPVNTTSGEVLFVINMKRAWEFLLNNLDYNNCFMLLREFNKICGVNLISNAGTIRVYDVNIGGTSWKPEIPIESRVLDDIHRINNIEDAVEKALEYFCYVCRTQIFCDGNKRVAQLIANKVLIENNIGILSVPVEYVYDFTGLLIKFYETNDSEELKGFLKNKCIQFI